MTDPLVLQDGIVLRRLEVGDAGALADAYLRNRDQLSAVEPTREESFYTAAAQEDRLGRIEQRQRDGIQRSYVMARGDRIVGTANLQNIVRGALCSADVGYWVDIGEAGRGLATTTVATLCRIADTELDLHRLAASTGIDNVASQRVLAKNGFTEYGLVTRYLFIAGAWSDSRLFQRILNDRPSKYAL
jgi:ribosomal-protein-alanine N-acetyltransferase